MVESSRKAAQNRVFFFQIFLQRPVEFEAIKLSMGEKRILIYHLDTYEMLFLPPDEETEVHQRNS